MEHCFDVDRRHSITASNINHYVVSAPHPNRCLQEHDFIYVLDGAWKIGQEREHYDIQKDDVLILAAGLEHYGIEPCAPGTRTVFIHAWALETDVCGGENKVSLISHIRAKHNPAVRQCFERVAYAKSCHDDVMASVYFDALLYELRACLQMTSQNTVAEQIRRLVLASDTIMTNGEIAERLHVSIKTAEQSFKKQFGTTIHRFQLEAKMESARFCLVHFPDMRLSEIAANLGFYDEFHFSRQFRKWSGISPGEFRKRSLKGV